MQEETFFFFNWKGKKIIRIFTDDYIFNTPFKKQTKNNLFDCNETKQTDMLRRNNRHLHRCTDRQTGPVHTKRHSLDVSMQSVWKLRMAFLRGVDSLCTTCLFYNCVNYRDQPDTSSLVMMSISLITLMMRLTPSVLRQLSARLWRQRVQFNSIQFKMVAMGWENPIRAPRCLRNFSVCCQASKCNAGKRTDRMAARFALIGNFRYVTGYKISKLY